MDRSSRIQAQRGISLVESLVALVVMSVGMLGIASLYVTSLKAGRTALTRTQAVNLVNDMADRIRANSSGRNAYTLADYDTPPATQDCSQTNCSAAQIAQNDLATWLTALRAVLPPSAVGNVKYVVSPNGNGRPDDYRIDVSWLEPGESRNFSYGLNVQVIAVTP